MKKKAKTSTQKKQTASASRDLLPQNIQRIGERGEENKEIYIHQQVYRQIRRFTKNKTVNESGGMLVGKVTEAFGKTNIIISAFVEAKHCEATPTTLKFTHETWEYVHKEIAKKHPGQKILGWIHTHPDFGIFLSEYDKFIHGNFFGEDHQIAFVVDPIRNEQGFYFWINGALQRCPGFFLYDKTGKTVLAENTLEKEPAGEGRYGTWLQNALIVVLVLAVFVLTLNNISMNKRLRKLEQRCDALTYAHNSLAESFVYTHQELEKVAADLANLQTQVQQYHPVQDSAGE